VDNQGCFIKEKQIFKIIWPNNSIAVKEREAFKDDWNASKTSLPCKTSEVNVTKKICP